MRKALLILVLSLVSCALHSDRYATSRPYHSRLHSNVSDKEGLELDLLSEVNRFRRERGKAPLGLDTRLSDIAEKHSVDMAQEEIPYGHEGFSNRGHAVEKSIPFNQFGENVCYFNRNGTTDDPVEEIMRSWINSPDHLANLLGDFQLTGIGIAFSNKGEIYVTQLYVSVR